MRQNTSWLALLCGISGLLLACGKPCQTTSECGGGQVCAAALCQTLSCETAFFAQNPATGECTALSGCFLTPDQAGWTTCSQDPCGGLSESACLLDSRCQVAYASPDQPAPQGGSSPPSRGVACAGGIAPSPPPNPNGVATAPGVNNGEAPKHPDTIGGGCFAATGARAYAGCRAVPRIPADLKPCAQLTQDQCGARTDCSTSPVAPAPTPGPIVFNGGSGGAPAGAPNQGPQACFDRFPRATACPGADAMSCLTNPACQPIGAKCYCPPGASCPCSDGGAGAFLGCEDNDRLRRCQTTADCNRGERCDNDEACIQPRTFASLATGPTPVPGTGSCLGACVPTGCAGFGERLCGDHPECDAGTYATVCHPKAYCAGGGILTNDPVTGGPNMSDPGMPGVGTNCGCDDEFTACAAQAPLDGLRPERSLLIRDPDIVTNAAFRLDTVLGSLAPAGRGDEFVAKWFPQIGAPQTLPNGAASGTRKGFTQFISKLAPGTLTLAGLAGLFHTTALVNRLDLAGPGDCGEARVTFAMNSAYDNGDQRMTIIVELKVPDDGNSCRTAAQRWAELSAIDDTATRLSRLQALYAELLAPHHLGQVRTNEFVNQTGVEPWELREWHIGADGMLAAAPVKQTVAPAMAVQAALLDWARQNSAALKAGTAIVPAQFLAASSTENGSRLVLSGSATDATLKDAETAINGLSCAGCHLTETKSPFAHLGERLGAKIGAGYQPEGRAVIDEFLRKDLANRAANMQKILGASPQMLLSAPWRGALAARVH